MRKGFDGFRQWNRNRAGFTIIEVMVAVAITGISAGLALPNFTRFVDNHRLETSAQAVWSDMQNAKMTAIKDNQTVVVTRTSSQAYTYASSDGFGNVRTVHRNLAEEFNGITVTFGGAAAGGGTVSFLSTGMAGAPLLPGGSSAVITLSTANSTRSFTITWTGNISDIGDRVDL